MALRLLNLIVGLLMLIHSYKADIYFHNPRGSNNRLDEAGRARNNANRLFDSQNNDRGGYNVGSLFYYAGSVIPIEWTNQHSCNNPNNHCELIIQYMCGNQIRDGATTTTIPNNRMQCKNYDCNTDRRFGMHEDYYYYQQCQLRERNKGLFTADQNLNNRNRQQAKNTRQNPGGTRRGYECPEERDYYPYWHPSPWKDVVVMTNNVSRCQYYRAESQNVKSRWACILPMNFVEQNKKKGLLIPNNKEACDAFRYPKNDPEGVRGVWTEFPAHGVPAPDCQETEFSRDNHLGNGVGGQPLMYNWTIPDIEGENCVLRIRYNISTNDYDPWTTDASFNANPKKLNEGAKVPLAEEFGFANEDAAADRGYIFENNPEVQLFPGINMKLRLAINTAQFGRTFQDRSHTFAVQRRPSELQDVTIHNLNVRGKRGNIVQVYPAVEYDFVPNTLEMSTGDYVHFQWTGSNTNPRNNDGQGLAGTDRNNIVLLGAQKYPEGTGVRFGPAGVFGHYGVNYPMHLVNTTFLGLNKDDMVTLAYLNPGQFRGEMSELDDAGTYFNLPPKRGTTAGTYHYMCTRNNNFSNRDQKGRIVIFPFPVAAASVGWLGGNVTLKDRSSKVAVEQGVFSNLQKLRLEEWDVKEGEQKLAAKNKKMTIGDDYASKFLTLYPAGKLAANGRSFTVELELTSSASGVSVYHSDPNNFATWTKVDADVDGGVARFAASEGGTYVARAHSNPGAIVGGVIGALVIVAIIVGAIIYFKRNPGKWQSIQQSCRNTERSFKNKV